MFKTKRIPVKVYRWDDPGAPQVHNAPGSIKTILKACLSTGYGDGEQRKAPLGWDMLFEEEQKACFKSRDPQSSGWALGVDDSIHSVSKAYAAMRLLKQPSSAVTGALVRELGVKGFTYAGNYASRFLVQWVLVGHERAFCLFSLSSGGLSHCPVMYFGDFPSLAVADENNCIFFANQNIGDGWLGDGVYGMEYRIAADYKGDNTRAAVISKIAGSRQMYPNPVTNGFCADDLYIYEEHNSKWSLRGMLPGLLEIMEEMPGGKVLPFGTIYDNLDGTGDQYMYIRYNGTYGRLINLTAWEI